MKKLLKSKSSGKLKLEPGKIITFLILIILISAVACSQNKDLGQGKKDSRMFNAATVETLEGQITSVTKQSFDKGIGNFIWIDLKTANEAITVHLGPGWFLEEKEFELNEKDDIKVTGSRVTITGKEIIIATEIVKGGKSLKLRQADGTPLWIGFGAADLYDFSTVFHLQSSFFMAGIFK